MDNNPSIRQGIETYAGEEKVDAKPFLGKLEAKYGKEKLEIVLDTKDEVAELRQWLELNDKDVTSDSGYLSADYKGEIFDNLIRENQAEEEIKKLPGIDKVVQNVEDLRSLSVDDLVKLEDSYPGILLYAFTDIVGADTKLDFEHWDCYKKPTPGMKLQVNFHGNVEAEEKIGSGDIMPVSVRCVTVYEDGDASRARTSKFRVGMQGRNESGTGFFDDSGYMPIYSGDVVVIGGAAEPQKGIDMGFEKKYPNREAYEKSEQYKQDSGQLASMVAKNPTARSKKNLSTEEIAAVMDSVDNGSVQGKLMQAIKTVIGEEYYPTCCWDWLNKVYKSAGVTKRERIYQNLNYEGKDCGQCHAPDALVGKLRPGDWIYYNNRNTADTHGNHSAIFCGWQDEGKRIAILASGSHGRIGKYHTADLIDKPVTHITRPLA